MPKPHPWNLKIIWVIITQSIIIIIQTSDFMEMGEHEYKSQAASSPQRGNKETSGQHTFYFHRPNLGGGKG